MSPQDGLTSQHPAKSDLDVLRRSAGRSAFRLPPASICTRRWRFSASPRRYGWVALPRSSASSTTTSSSAAAIVMYVIEFIADKIPWVDSMWDAVHTVIRPIGGAVIAVATLGDASPAVEGVVALLGGTLAAGTSLHQGRHARGRQHQPRAVLELDPQPVAKTSSSSASASSR